MDYLAHLVNMCAIYGMAVVALDLAVGTAGLLSLAHAALFGVGAYAGGVVAITLGFPFVAAAAVAVAAGAAAGRLVAVLARWTEADYFVLATFALQVLAYTWFVNAAGATGGAIGMIGIPPPSLGPVQLRGAAEYLPLSLAALAASMWLVARVRSSFIGRALLLLRESRRLSESLGWDSAQLHGTALTWSGGIIGLAGFLYGSYLSFVDPSSFSVAESIVLLSMVIVGGASSRWGPVLGAGLVLILPEALRFVGLPTSVAAHLREIAFGACLTLAMLVRPRGLVGQYGFETLGPRRSGTTDAST